MCQWFCVSMHITERGETQGTAWLRIVHVSWEICHVYCLPLPLDMHAPHLPRLCGFAHMPIAYLLLPFRALFSQLCTPPYTVCPKETLMCVCTYMHMCVCAHLCVCVWGGGGGGMWVSVLLHVQYTCTAPFFEQLGLR